VNIPILTALFNTEVYANWARRHSIYTSFKDEVGIGELTCVIKITPRSPWTPTTIRKEVDEQVLDLIKELGVYGFDVRTLGNAYCVGTSVFVRLY